jgi:hypothetical protein
LRARAFLSFAGALTAAVALVSASGAATATVQKVTPIDVSSRAAIVHYLRSIHVNPTGVVIQRGVRNYAGASCPGKGWSCTTTTQPVVQVAAAGGKNTFRCETASCAVVQVAAAPATLDNTATCIKTTGLSQTCTISQSSATKNNVAIVYQNALKSSGLTQTASSTASITQTATGSATSPNFNKACVYQNININGSTTAKKGVPVNVTLEAHQTVTIKQDSAHGGNLASSQATSTGQCGSAPLLQNQTLTSNANGSGSITQNENAANSGANVTIDIEQNQSAGFLGTATGGNSVNFEQDNTLTAIANTSAGPVNQTQSSSAGGILGTVNQDSRDPSTVVAVQHETQCEDAVTAATNTCDTADPDPPGYSLSQTQYGPVHKGVGTATQTDNGADTFTLTQTSTQDNDQGTGSQQTNDVHGDCHTSGNCTVNQTTNVDGQTTTSTQTGQNVDAQTTCSGSECTSSGTDFNVLIAGTGDFGDTEANDNMAAQLTSAGYTVTESPTLPADLSSFGEVWWIDDTAPTAAEQTQLVDFANSGKGVFLTGENIGCCGSVNAADQSMVNSIVTVGGITVGGEDVCCSGQTIAYPVNATVVGNLATQPHAITDWTATYPGTISGMPASSVFAYYQQTETTTQTVAAAWDRPSTVGKGRLVLFMDINWAQTDLQGANFSDVAENVAFFLSGLGSPPTPPVVLQAPITRLSSYGALAQMTPARTTAPAASGGITSTR